MLFDWFEEEEDWTDTAVDWLGVLGWVALGAGIMYFTDPKAGAQRRQKVVDALRSGYDATSEGVRGAADYTREHVKGYVDQARGRFGGEQSTQKTQGAQGPSTGS